MTKLTKTQKAIFRAIRASAPDAIDTEILLERLYWMRNRHNLKSQIYLLRRKGIPIVGLRGRGGGYYLSHG